MPDQEPPAPDNDFDIELGERDDYAWFRHQAARDGEVSALICLQGGGAKGGWQGGVLNAMLGDPVIRPVAVVGSSAGAINALLASSKIADPRNDPFRDFWGSIPRDIWKLFFQLAPRAALRLPRGLVDVAGAKMKIAREEACAPLVEFAAFRDVLAQRLEPLLPSTAAIHTYLYAVDSMLPRLPRVFDNQNLATFMANPGDRDMELAIEAVRVPRMDAVAASACLPFIGPLSIGTARYADGGLYSNLPVNVVQSQGSLAGACVICILATAIEHLQPTEFHTDYRSLVLLRMIRDARDRAAFDGMPVNRTPIFVIEPPQRLRSGLTDGFRFREFMDADSMLGIRQGEVFSSALRTFLTRGDTAGLRPYDLDFRKPLAEPEPPDEMPWWMDWVNPKW